MPGEAWSRTSLTKADTLTDGLLGDRVTVGRAHDWVYGALAQSIR